MLVGDALVFALGVVLFGFLTFNLGHWSGGSLEAGWWQWIKESPLRIYGAVATVILIALVLHFIVRKVTASRLSKSADRHGGELGLRGSLGQAFLKNTRPWRSIFRRNPVGWGRRTRRKITMVLENTDDYVQRLNDRFTNPSGGIPRPLDEPDQAPVPIGEPRLDPEPEGGEPDAVAHRG